MREQWRRFRRLSGRERRLLVHALLSLAVTSFGLRLLGFRRWQSVLGRLSVNRHLAPADQLKDAQRMARIVDTAARHSLKLPSCLEQSLVLWWLLHRQGIAAELRIGARKETNRFEAHAWVELEGVAFNDGNIHRHFVPLEDSVTPVETGVP